MKIAIATDDGRIVSTHLSRATHFAVFTVDRGVVGTRELRVRPVQQGHHIGAAPASSGDFLLAPIVDCRLVVARHIRWGTRDRMAELGLTPIVTDLVSVDEAAAECAAGRIANLARPLH